MTKGGIARWILAGGAIVGAASALFAFWNDWGWPFLKDYRIQHESVPTQQQMQVFGSQLEGLIKTVVEGHEHWECDELDEEMPDFRQAVLDANNNAERARAEHALEKKQMRWDTLKCGRFEDLD